MAEKLLSEVNKGDFPTEARHNEQGMFTIPDSEPASVDGEKMVQLESGIWIEAPQEWKVHRVLWLNGTSGGLASVECEESMDELKAAIAHAQSSEAKEWYEFTDPGYGHLVSVPGKVLASPLVITVQYKDMEAIKDEIKAQELQKRLARLQAASQDKSKNIVEAYKRNRN